MTLNLFTGFEAQTAPTPTAHQTDQLATMLDEVVTWSAALRPLHVA